MRKSKLSESQIIAVLKEGETGALSVEEICRKHGISSGTYYKLKTRYGRDGDIGTKTVEVIRGRESAAKEDVCGVDTFNTHSQPIVFSVEDALKNFEFQQKNCPIEHKDKTYLLIGEYDE